MANGRDHIHKKCMGAEVSDKLQYIMFPQKIGNVHDVVHFLGGGSKSTTTSCSCSFSRVAAHKLPSGMWDDCFQVAQASLGKWTRLCEMNFPNDGVTGNDAGHLY